MAETIKAQERTIRVLYSFPHKIGAGRICTTAWQQASGTARAGAQVLVYTGAVARSLPSGVKVRTTLARGRIRIPYRVLGELRALAVHDRIVARHLPSLAGQVDLVHTWPSGALDTLRVASRLGIPTVLERPNAHTRFAYEVVRQECERLGVRLPPGHEHAYNAEALRREEAEYELADRLLCPSEFVVRTFLEEGFPPEKLAQHSYGFDDTVFHPAAEPRGDRPFTMLFVGVAAVRKGLHYALEAWHRSPARDRGRFLIAGEMLASYGQTLAPMLDHPSVRVLGHRTEVPELMRASDVLVLPSIEEGSPLAAMEALGSGCVPVVSDVCAGACRHLENSLVHAVGDVETLTEHITWLSDDPSLLARLRVGALATAPDFTWSSAGRKLHAVYRDVVDSPSGVLQRRA